MRLLKGIPRWLWLVLCVLYVLSPWDLLPDVFGPPGLIDDLTVVLVTLLYLYGGFRMGRAGGGPGCSGGLGGGRVGRDGPRADGSTEGQTRAPKDPYEILGVTRGDELSEIRRRYRQKMLQYHPDRVQHLGKEFHEMAEQKARELSEAYQRILRERGAKA